MPLDEWTDVSLDTAGALIRAVTLLLYHRGELSAFHLLDVLESKPTYSKRRAR